MRKQLRDILQQPLSITQHRDTVQNKAVSIQESFYQNIGNILFLRRKQPTNNLDQLLKSFKGSFSNRMLKYKYMGYCMQKKLADQYHLFNVLNLLSSWIQFLDDNKKAKNLRFRQLLQFDVKYRGLDAFQDAIVYFHYIGIDLIGLLKRDQKESSVQQQKTQAQLKLQQQIHKKLAIHLDAADLLWLMNIILPKVLFNVIIPLDFFPENFLPFSGANIDLLYHNQNIQIVARSRQHYQNFVMTLIRMLIDVELDQSQTKELLLQSFKYYYLFHFSKQLKASQIVIDCFKKVSPAVRFAVSDQILLFFTILKKLGKQLFLSYLKDKFQWVAELLDKIDDQAMVGNPKQGLKPSPMADLPLVNSNEVPAGKKIERFIEVYHKYSLLFFKFKAVKDDINFRLYYLGDFCAPKERKELLITRQKESLQYQSSLEIVEAGIYMIQFDNSYSWMKSKHVYYEYTILVPMEIVAQRQKTWLTQVLFDKIEFNTVPEQKILRVIKDNEGSQLWRQQQIHNPSVIEGSGFSVKISYREQQEVYNLYMKRADGTVYEYQSEDRNLLIKKIKGIKSIDEEKIEWFINGIKADSMNMVIEQLQQERAKYVQLDQEEQQIQDQHLQSEETLKQLQSQFQSQNNKHSSTQQNIEVDQQFKEQQDKSKISQQIAVKQEKVDQSESPDASQGAPGSMLDNKQNIQISDNPSEFDEKIGQDNSNKNQQSQGDQNKQGVVEQDKVQAQEQEQNKAVTRLEQKKQEQQETIEKQDIKIVCQQQTKGELNQQKNASKQQNAADNQVNDQNGQKQNESDQIEEQKQGKK